MNSYPNSSPLPAGRSWIAIRRREVRWRDSIATEAQGPTGSRRAPCRSLPHAESTCPFFCPKAGAASRSALVRRYCSSRAASARSLPAAPRAEWARRREWVLRLQFFSELCQIAARHPELGGDQSHRVPPRACASTLDLSQAACRDPGTDRQRFLAETAFFAQLADCATEPRSRLLWASHQDNAFKSRAFGL